MGRRPSRFVPIWLALIGGAVSAQQPTLPPVPLITAVESATRVRLGDAVVDVIGIEPFPDDAGCQAEATALLSDLVVGRPVRVEVDPAFEAWRERHAPERIARHVLLEDGRLVARVLAEAGCVRVASAPHRYVSVVEDASRAAQLLNRGHYAPRVATATAPSAPPTRSSTSAPIPIMPGGWRWTGTGDKETETFEVSTRPWRVRWRAAPSNTLFPGSLRLTLYTEDGQLVTTAGSGDVRGVHEDVSYVRQTGRFYFRIESVLLSGWGVAVETNVDAPR